MPIAVTCPSCKARTKAPDTAAGRKAKCPKCGSAVYVPAPTDVPGETEDRTPPPHPPTRRSRRTLFIGAGVAVVALQLLGGGSYLIWDGIAERNRKAKAEVALRDALTLWCSDRPLPDLTSMASSDTYQFSEFGSRLSTDPRPTGYQMSAPTWVRGGAYSVYQVPVTLTFVGGPETRLFEVEVHRKSGKCFINTKASEDISGTEAHARTVLQTWLDTWVAGGDMAGFKRAHPEAAAKMTVDLSWASLNSEGKRLVQYDITPAGPAPGPSGGYRFNVTAVLEQRGTPETKILRYEVFKDRALSEGRWTVLGK